MKAFSLPYVHVHCGFSLRRVSYMYMHLIEVFYNVNLRCISSKHLICCKNSFKKKTLCKY